MPPTLPGKDQINIPGIGPVNIDGWDEVLLHLHDHDYEAALAQVDVLLGKETAPDVRNAIVATRALIAAMADGRSDVVDDIDAKVATPLNPVAGIAKIAIAIYSGRSVDGSVFQLQQLDPALAGKIASIQLNPVIGKIVPVPIIVGPPPRRQSGP